MCSQRSNRPRIHPCSRRAKEAGVMVAALSCEVSPRGVAVLGALPVHVP